MVLVIGVSGLKVWVVRFRKVGYGGNDRKKVGRGGGVLIGVLRCDKGWWLAV